MIDNQKEMKYNTKLSKMNVVAVLFIVVVFGVLLVFVQHNINSLSDMFNSLSAGDLIEENIVAGRKIEFVDMEATEALKQKARESSVRIYVRNDYNAAETMKSLERDVMLDRDHEAEYGHLVSIVNSIYNSGFFDSNDLGNDTNGYIEYYGRRYEKKDLYNSDNVIRLVRDRFDLGEDEDFIVSNIGRYLVPNVRCDFEQSMVRSEARAAQIPAVRVKYDKGDVIFFKDEVLTPSQTSIFRKIKRSENSYSLLSLVMCMLFAALSTSVSFIMLKDNLSKRPMRAEQFFYLAVLIEVIYLILTLLMYFAAQRNVFFQDVRFFICLPSMFIKDLTGDRHNGYIIMALNMIFMVLLPFLTLAVMAKAAVSCLIAINFFRLDADSKKSFEIWFYIILMIAFSVGVLDVFFHERADVIFFDCIFEVVKATLCMVFSAVIMGPVGNFIDLPTSHKLKELANEQTELLMAFKRVCPGSYEHSDIVADIAENAAKAIGADYMLVRAAARYHDVGKMDHPEYFIENQQGSNKHDLIKSKFSAAIIRSHVSGGVKKLRECGLGIPEEVIQLIYEHHGNDLIAYFYNEAKREQIENVTEDDYCYKADPPGSRESAILMLADITEAAVRSYRESASSRGEFITEARLREFIHNLVQGKIDRKQLENCGITIGEINLVENSLYDSVYAKDHRRIEYNNAPGEKEKADERK